MYLVWAYDNYYPTGPDDLKGIYSTQEEAEQRQNNILFHGGYDHVIITVENMGDTGDIY